MATKKKTTKKKTTSKKTSKSVASSAAWLIDTDTQAEMENVIKYLHDIASGKILRQRDATSTIEFLKGYKTSAEAAAGSALAQKE